MPSRRTFILFTLHLGPIAAVAFLPVPAVVPPLPPHTLPHHTDALHMLSPLHANTRTHTETENALPQITIRRHTNTLLQIHHYHTRRYNTLCGV